MTLTLHTRAASCHEPATEDSAARCTTPPGCTSLTAAPRREDERHDARQQPEERIAFLQPAAANQLEDDKQEQDRRDRSGNRNAKGRRRHFSSKGVGERRKSPTNSASVTLIM